MNANMSAKHLTIVLAGGAVAGAIGTLAMDPLWFRRSKRSGNDQSFTDWEFSGDTNSFEEAGAPAKLGESVAATVGVDLPDGAAGATTDVVHWLTGLGWGAAGALLTATMRTPPAVAGLAAGAAAFGAAYTVLPAMGLYDPIWDDDGTTIWKDASAHATFGVATGAALTAVAAAASRS